MTRVDPICLILIESDLWPQLLLAARRRRVPVVVLSAKISDRTYRRLSKIPTLAKRLLLSVTHYFVQDTTTLLRLEGLGVPLSRITLSGNFKLTPPDPFATNKYEPLTKQNPNVLVFGNVHPEEAVVLADTAERMLRAYPLLEIFFVPRHPSKFSEQNVNSLFGRGVAFVTEQRPAANPGQISWINKMGVLSSLYEMAGIAVVGGTFCDIGGHDLVEPLHRGALAIYGPKIASQRSLHSWLKDKPYSFQISNGEELFKIITSLLQSPSKAAELRQKALEDLARFRFRSNEIAASIAQLTNNR